MTTWTSEELNKIATAVTMPYGHRKGINIIRRLRRFESAGRPLGPAASAVYFQNSHHAPTGADKG